MSDDVKRLLERADAIEAEALAGKWLVGRTTHAPHYDDCLTCEPVRIAAALAARLRVAEARLDRAIAVAEWQARGDVHELTCGTDSRHRPLVPSREGLRCLDCAWTQSVPSFIAARASEARDA